MDGILLPILVWWQLLDKLPEWICRTVGPLDPLAHPRNVANLGLFYRYYFGEWSSELAQLVPFPYSSGRSTCYSDGSHDFTVTIRIGAARMSISTVAFLAQLDSGILCV